MSLRVFLTPAAEADVDEAHAWYAEREASLGEGFHRSLEDCIEGIARRPESHAIVHGPVRRALLHRFPYCVFYAIESDRVVVQGCFHARRDPQA